MPDASSSTRRRDLLQIQHQREKGRERRRRPERRGGPPERRDGVAREKMRRREAKERKTEGEEIRVALFCFLPILFQQIHFSL
jgi:hypothetical protein